MLCSKTRLDFSFCFFFFKQKTAYEMRISDWSSDVCSSDLSSGARGRSLRLCPHARARRGVGNARRRRRRLCRRPHRQTRRGTAEGAEKRQAALLPRRRLVRESVVEGKSVSVRVDLGVRRVITTQHTPNENTLAHSHNL